MQRHSISRGSILAYLQPQRRIWARKPRLFSVPRAHRAPSWPGRWAGTRPRDWWRRWRSGSLTPRPFWLRLLESLTRGSRPRDRGSSARCWATGPQSTGSRQTSPWAGRRQASRRCSARRSGRRGTRRSPWACCRGCCYRSRLGVGQRRERQGQGPSVRPAPSGPSVHSSPVLRGHLAPLQR